MGRIRLCRFLMLLGIVIVLLLQAHVNKKPERNFTVTAVKLLSVDGRFSD